MIKDVDLIDNILLLTLKEKPSDNGWAECAEEIQKCIDYIRQQKKEWDAVVKAEPIEMSEDDILEKIFKA